jgi:hypothetical protein
MNKQLELKTDLERANEYVTSKVCQISLDYNQKDVGVRLRNDPNAPDFYILYVNLTSELGRLHIRFFKDLYELCETDDMTIIEVHDHLENDDSSIEIYVNKINKTKVDEWSLHSIDGASIDGHQIGIYADELNDYYNLYSGMKLLSLIKDLKSKMNDIDFIKVSWAASNRQVEQVHQYYADHYKMILRKKK